MWLKQSAMLHPDRIRDPLERMDAADRLAELNDARLTLADDERRANALHALLGGPSARDDQSLPDGFLMEIMEVREAMETALSDEGDAGRSRFESWAQDRRVQHLSAITTGFETLESLDSETDRSAALRAVRVELNAWRYIERMIEQLDPDHDALHA